MHEYRYLTYEALDSGSIVRVMMNRPRMRNAQKRGLLVELSAAADRTLEFARRIARVPTATLLLIKESVNQTQDNMGFYNALNACFALHQLNHAHWAEVNGDGYPAARPESGEVPHWKDAPPVRPRSPHQVGGDGAVAST